MSVRGRWTKALRCAAFLCILGLLLFFLGKILRQKNHEYLPSKEPQLEGSECEVLLLGPSTIMNGVYPLQLWDEYGMVSYNCGTGGQSFTVSYYVLKELIKRGNPKLVVLDCGKARSKRTVVEIGNLHYATDVMRYFAPERWELIKTASVERGYSFDEVMGIALPVIAYHERWQHLKRSDFQRDIKYTTYGAKVDPRVCTEADPLEPYAASPDASLSPVSETYLRKIIDLCREQGIQLLLMTFPNMTTAYDVSQRGYCARVDAAAAVQKVADECGVTHLNLIDEGTAIGLTPRTDTGDGQHLNYHGARIFTSWLGAYLRDHFDVADHSGDPSYAYLDEAYAAFSEYASKYVAEWAAK